MDKEIAVSIIRQLDHKEAVAFFTYYTITEANKKAEIMSEIASEAIDKSFDNLRLKKDDDEWIPWSGGENPVPGKKVDFIYRDGEEIKVKNSNLYRWEHQQLGTYIIKYRVVEDE